MKKLANLGGIFWGMIVAFIALSGALGFLYYQSNQQFAALKAELASLNAQLAASTTLLGEKTSLLEKDIETKTADINHTLTKEQQRVSSIAEEVSGVGSKVGTITGTVTNLEKLAKTDPELLQKYSKVFFLNEHYQPPRLVEIDKPYLYSESQTHKIHSEVWPHLQKMLDASMAAGIETYVKSAFRSFNEQANIKTSYSIVYGAGTANTFSADQGYSEHQLGTTVDLITTGLGGQLNGFENTASFKWLTENAYKYGFILSYPAGNSHYIFEPWHWRYVGVALATYLHNNNKNFYDLDQREIDEYLVKIFD